MLRTFGTGDLLSVVAVLLIVFSASRVDGWGERLGELVNRRPRGRPPRDGAGEGPPA